MKRRNHLSDKRTLPKQPPCMGYRRNECTLVLKNRASIKYTAHEPLTEKRFKKERKKRGSRADLNHPNSPCHMYRREKMPRRKPARKPCGKALNGLDNRPAGGKIQLIPAILVAGITISTGLFHRERIVVVVQHRAEILVGENTPVTCVRDLSWSGRRSACTIMIHMWGMENGLGANLLSTRSINLIMASKDNRPAGFKARDPSLINLSREETNLLVKEFCPRTAKVHNLTGAMMPARSIAIHLQNHRFHSTSGRRAPGTLRPARGKSPCTSRQCRR